jgi:hypothetical protein
VRTCFVVRLLPLDTAMSVAKTDVSERRRSLVNPRYPERVCWGCKLYCPAHDLKCGADVARTPHPSELLGAGWARLPSNDV